MKARQLDALESKRIRRGDAVKILDRSHDYSGFTGRVLHVDARDPGREVAEVRCLLPNIIVHVREGIQD